MFVGQMTDRYGRRRIVFLSLTIEELTAGFLLKGSINGWLG
jgi:MFS family permease